jgi:hypothetical protein
MIELQGFHNVVKQLEGPDWYIVGATIAVAIATVVLAIITAFYAIQTKRLVTVTKELAKRPFLPCLQADYDPHMQRGGQYTGNIVLRVKNVGVGNAIDIVIQYSVSGLSITGQEHFTVITPGGSEDWLLPLPQPKREEDVQIDLDYKYRDLLGEIYPDKQTLIVKGYDEN